MQKPVAFASENKEVIQQLIKYTSFKVKQLVPTMIK